ncbi:LOW QUALITY PROTEIN: BTB/POZ domain-containing protein KCTD19-like [Mixophyes fleayi]|uniref:LOW QUALITY PROTEIN: BTB/POZ domain-containing protein KCTD19-like n=1 Tax=Mixophyes fleayi TaxID=3061075 RepID=UPI003F4DCC44
MAENEQPPGPVDTEPAVGLTDVLHCNVGGWLFSIPKMTLAPFWDSVLWEEASAQPDTTKIFIDRDGSVFRNLHHFLLTSQLPLSSWSDLGLSYELARGLHLQPVIEALDKVQDRRPQQREQTEPDTPITERSSINYWKSPKCSSRLSEFPVKSSLSSGTQDRAPLGLVDTPLIDAEEEVHYCFFPIHALENYPTLVTDDNLLWFSESFFLIECGCDEFRFIGNFLLSGKFLLPEKFSKFEVLEAEVKSLRIPGVFKALNNEKKSLRSNYCSRTDKPVAPSNRTTGQEPFYVMALELLAKYPDSALGQLTIESSIDGSKLYIAGTGTLFLHVTNWLETCRLPLTSSRVQICGLCTLLDQGDITYHPMRDAVRSYLQSRTGLGPGTLCNNWTADVQELPQQQIVRVYVGMHWYATYLGTLLKYPELLNNTRKTRWISCGFSLLVNGDGQMFRHILNFLRLGSLFLPSAFQEWSLFCQEVNEFNIPSLVEALHECNAYRLWLEKQVPSGRSEDLRREVIIVCDICQ